ncbi:hypothetical protein [Nitrosomonas sp.]|uniref:hypothetical protein n=1 Tax=Nitrosomonas sp. TaxID=42353 RepID=UPI0025CFD226|nr:hypothetical protein [Nitrosomonas sp.]MBV6447298.1 hypothetical protein [Nitrosomonas sp.]
MKINDTRRRILQVVYREMRAHPNGFGLPLADLSGHVPDDYDFDLNYLFARGLLVRCDGNLKLTPDGIDIIEEE